MSVRILRRLKAAQDAEETADYLAKDSLETAVRFLENTRGDALRLGQLSRRGQPVCR